MARKGRPAFKATAAMRRKVEQMVACGMTREEISRAIGCTPPTLDKHFADELKTGHARKKAEAVDLLWRQARKGNASALRKLLDEIRLAGADAGVTRPDVPKPQRLGKKQAAQAAAQTAGEGTEWGDDLAVPEDAAIN